MAMHPNQAAAYLGHGDQEIQRLARSYLELLVAVQEVYYGAVWIADRPVDEKQLWENLRDKAGFIPGNSPTITEFGKKLQALK